MANPERVTSQKGSERLKVLQLKSYKTVRKCDERGMQQIEHLTHDSVERLGWKRRQPRANHRNLANGIQDFLFAVVIRHLRDVRVGLRYR